MRGRLAANAKLGRSLHQAAAKVTEPNVIDDHAGDQWIVIMDQPSRQGQPAAAAFIQLTLHLAFYRLADSDLAEHLWNLWLEFLGLVGGVRIAAHEEIGRPRQAVFGMRQFPVLSG